MNFAVGDVVRLKSGGPRMTVLSANGEDVQCVWFEGSTRVQGHFTQAGLKMAEPVLD